LLLTGDGGQHNQYMGSLQVFITPFAAVQDGAVWFLDNEENFHIVRDVSLDDFDGGGFYVYYGSEVTPLFIATTSNCFQVLHLQPVSSGLIQHTAQFGGQIAPGTYLVSDNGALPTSPSPLPPGSALIDYSNIAFPPILTET
jgi:hypothetical protein